MTQSLEGLSKQDKAQLAQFAQEGLAVSLSPSIKQDLVEAASGAPATPAAAKADLAENPLGAHAPRAAGNLPPGSEKKVFTLFDALAALGPLMMANALASNNDVKEMSNQTNRITDLGLKLEGFQATQRQLQKEIEKQVESKRLLGFIEQAVFGFMAILFATMIAGPAGGIAAAIAVGTNITLEDSGAYNKMTKHMSPTEALFTKLGISIAVGIVCGGITAGGMTAIDSAGGTAALAEGAGNAARGAGRTIARSVGRRAATTAAEDAVNPNAVSVEMDTFIEDIGNEGEEAVTTVDEEASSTAKNLVKQEGKEMVNEAKGEKGEGAGNVKARSLQRTKRSAWMALTGMQTVLTGFSSKSKGEKTAHDVFGDIAFQIAKDCHKSTEEAEKIAKWTQMGAGLALSALEMIWGGKLIGGAAAESTEGAFGRITRLAGNAGFAFNSAGQVGTGTYEAITGFELRSEYNKLGDLAKVTATIEKEAETAKMIQGFFSQALQSSTRTNQEMMTTVFGVIQNISTALGAAANSRAA